MTEQPKADDVVIVFAIEILITQDSFLLETERLMKLNRALVVRQRFAVNFLQFQFGKCMAERQTTKLPPASFRSVRCHIKTPISNTADFRLVEVHEPQGLPVDFKNQQMSF